MKHVDVATLETTAAPVMIKMTRREKLRRWAGLVRAAPYQLFLYHDREYMPPEWLASPRNLLTGSYANAFAIALSDPVLAAEGLKGDSIADVQKFMELSKADTHEFSCDCGGVINNEEMARRIERIAG